MTLDPFESSDGAPLDAVRRFLGAEIVEVSPVSDLRPASAVRGVVRLTLADGRRVKLRRMATPEQARAVAALLDALDEPALPRAAFVAGRLVVERWVEGAPLEGHRDLVAHARSLGALLGRVHTARVPGAPAPPAGAPTAGARARFERHVADLVAAGALDGPDGDRARALVGATLPAHAEVGIVHRDLCAANVVVPADGRAVVVDNESLRVAALDGDLGLTFARWPMAAEVRAALLAGYATRRDPTTALRDERAWRVLAVTKSLHVRVVRWRVPATDVLADLRALLRPALTRP
jgi:Ser/Thr protein kinase RdoA (MazF antagonist)